MSKITDNLLVRGARGKMGNQFVYKQRGEDTFITRMPKINKNAVPTESQEKMRDRFGEASLYAQGAMADADLKEAYQRKLAPGKTAYNAAFRDYLKAPAVTGIDAAQYNGQPGQRITVRAKDDFRVAGVQVSIRTATGELVEAGEAVLDPINRNRWIYTTRAINPAMPGSSVEVTARDIPGNEGKQQLTL